MNQKNKSCIIDGVEYKSVTEAQKALNVSSSTLRHRFQSALFPQYIRHGVVKNEGTSGPCVINGVKYPSYSVAAKTLGIKQSTIRWRLNSPNFPEYTFDLSKEKK